MTTTDETVPDARTRVTGTRVAQFILDGLLVGVVLAVLGSIGESLLPGVGFDRVAGSNVGELLRLTVSGGGGLPSGAAVVLIVAVWATVFLVVPLLRDRTPAMALLGLRIVRLDGTAPTAGQHAVRAALLVFEGAGGGFLAWLVIVCSRRRQRIGDHLAGTLVVRS